MSITRRKFLRLLKAPGFALLCSASPLGIERADTFFARFSTPVAHAKDDDDDSSSNSGSGSSNSGRDEDDDDDNDDDDDRGGPGRNGGSNRRDDRNRSSDRGKRLESRFNLTIRYSNGWFEQIRDGRYVFKDPKGRTVANRLARMDDYKRMREAVGD